MLFRLLALASAKGTVRIERAVVLFACVLFAVQGLLFVPLAGVQQDEAAFSAPLYQPMYGYQEVSIFGKPYPLMLVNYLGTVKTWIYAPMFKLLGISVWTVRVPVIVFGSLTVYLFWHLLRRSIGPRAAMVGCLLLATDTTFLLTIVFDWGPVVLQHLLMVAGLLLLLRFCESGQVWWLGAGFLLFGLAIWDKAVFVWMLAGLAAGAALVYPRELVRAGRGRTLLIACAVFLVGASPFLLYNIQHRSQSVGSMVRLSSAEFGAKLAMVPRAAGGSALLTYIPASPEPKPPSTMDLVITCGYGAALLVGLVYGRRPFWFSLVALLAAWLLMAFTRNAGGSAHHTILLWPMPCLMVAAAFAGAPEKLPRRVSGGVLAAVVAVLCCGHLWATCQNYAALVRRGTSAIWSDAILKLPAELKPLHASHVVAADWGMIDNLILLSGGELPVRGGVDLFTDKPEAKEREAIEYYLDSPGTLILSYADEQEISPGRNRRVREMAASAGFQLELVDTVFDRKGRAVYVIWRPRRR